MSDVVHPQGGHEGTEMGLFPPRDSPNKPIVMKTEAHVCRTSEIATAGQGSEGKTEPSAWALNQGSGGACDSGAPSGGKKTEQNSKSINTVARGDDLINKKTPDTMPACKEDGNNQDDKEIEFGLGTEAKNQHAAQVHAPDDETEINKNDLKKTSTWSATCKEGANDINEEKTWAQAAAEAAAEPKTLIHQVDPSRGSGSGDIQDTPAGGVDTSAN